VSEPTPASSDTARSNLESTLPGPLGVLDTAIAHIESIMLATGVLLMALNTVANVVGRFIFRSSIYFTEELNSNLIVLITFAGISYAARHGRVIRMSAIFDALPVPVRRMLMILIAAVTAVFMFGLCWFSVGYITTLAGQGRVLPALGIPVWWSYVWVPVGFFMTGVQYALTAVKNAADPDIWLSTLVIEGYSDDEQEI
jgi:TRAP-type C4-dicarboxylate transport system permease small subunit